MFESTLTLVKPHAVAARWTKAIHQRWSTTGLWLSRMQVLTLTREEAVAFYAEHAGKEFFELLINTMISGPVVAMVWVGWGAVKKIRDMNGATNPAEAMVGTIRRDFRGPGGPLNTVHGSDSLESALREIAIIFGS